MLSQPKLPQIAQRAGLIIALLVGVGSCMDKEFDLSKPISMQLTLHAKFDLDLGSTDTFRLGDDKLMGSLDSGLLVIDPVDGTYSMKMSGDENVDMPTFDLTLPIPACSSQDSVDINIDVDLKRSITIDPPDMNASVTIPPNVPEGAQLPSFPITAYDSNTTPFEIAFTSDEFPSQVETIHKIAFGDYDGDNGNGSLVSFSIYLQGMHDAIGAGSSGDLYGYHDTIKILTIEFPPIFQLGLNPQSETRQYESLNSGTIKLLNLPTTNKDSVVLNFYVKSLVQDFSGEINLQSSISTELSYSLQPIWGAVLNNSAPQIPLRFNIDAELHFNDVEVTTKPIPVPVQGNTYEVASGLVDIPSQITCVREVEFGSAVYLPFAVFSTGLPFAVQSGTIPIEFPKALQFAAGQTHLIKDPITDRWTYMLQASEAFGGEMFRDSLKLDRLNISWTREGEGEVALVDDSVLIVDDTIMLAPKRAWANRLIREANAKNFWFNFELYERELMPHSVTACLVDSVVEAQTFAFALDLPDMLRGDSINLALKSPGIAFEVVNPLSVPLNVELAVSDGKGNERSGIMSIVAATGINSPATSLIYMTGNRSDVPQGYDWVNINVVDIIRSVPDSVFISATPIIANNSGSHKIYLAGVQDDTFKMHYDVDVPVAFDTGFQFMFADTIAFDGIDLSKYEVDGKLMLTVGFVSSLPVGLTLDLIAMDSLYNPLPNVNLKAEGGIPPGDLTNAGLGSIDVSLTLNEDNKDDFGKVRAIYVRLMAKSGDRGGALSSKQYVIISLGINFDANVGIDLDDL